MNSNYKVIILKKKENNLEFLLDNIVKVIEIN